MGLLVIVFVGDAGSDLDFRRILCLLSAFGNPATLPRGARKAERASSARSSLLLLDRSIRCLCLLLDSLILL